jgi:hypothetical protein
VDIQEAIVQALKDSILRTWDFEKKLQNTINLIAQEIEEITEEMAELTGEKLEKYEAMLNAAKESNQRAARRLEEAKKAHIKLRSEYEKLKKS